MDRPVFISFSSHDREKAKLICERLEQAGLPCWISLRDVPPGENYQAAIVKAIQASKVFVLVFSGHSNQSGEIHKELSLASAFKAAVMPVRIADVRPEGALLYELATRQWIDTFEAWESSIDHLAATIQRTLAAGPDAATIAATMDLLPPRPAPQPTAAGMAAPAAKPSEPPAALAPEELDAARVALASYLGPIAAMLVRKAAANAKSLADLHDRLAAHIPAAAEQEAFRRRLKRRV